MLLKRGAVNEHVERENENWNKQSWKFEMKFLIGLGFMLGFVPIFIFLLTVLFPHSLFPVFVAFS